MGVDAVIIEDEESISLAVKYILNFRGISALEAHSGAEGIALVRREHPGVVLLDIRLPDTDGWDICRQIKRLAMPAPAVLFLTAATQARDRRKALEAGGDYFIPKPFEVRQLVSLVQKILASRGRDAMGAER
jgi:DNA-binding response OmpR family regulator